MMVEYQQKENYYVVQIDGLKQCLEEEVSRC